MRTKNWIFIDHRNDYLIKKLYERCIPPLMHEKNGSLELQGQCIHTYIFYSSLFGPIVKIVVGSQNMIILGRYQGWKNKELISILF